MRFLVASFVILLFSLSGCSSSKQFQDPIPLHTTFTLQSKQVGELRTINVWMPVEQLKTQDSFPVLYMPDGGIKEDFPHIANTLSKLINSGKIPPMILVGIENTKRRKDLTGPTVVETDKEIAAEVGGSFPFRAFIQEELMPEINKRYPTTHKKGIIGESLAGLFVIETFLLHPEMFDYYIAFDPSLWWNNRYLEASAKTRLVEFPTTEKRLWFAGSGTEEIVESTRNLAKILEEEHLPQIGWYYSEELREKHSTIFRATKEKALIWMFGTR
ncbi:MAG: alpha/beta hydrolase [Chitinophagaceae bacterium]|nr:alpha/beta hydrolase [Bacteroidota bacterium]MCC6259092.1 alpha/beta hydrolase [Chitinophagaceae bacterium]MCW5917575.1 alpha/beta hydrolase [Ferruginibacter sp.]